MNADGLPAWDVHAHYLADEAVPSMATGQAEVVLKTVGLIRSRSMATDQAGIDRWVLLPPPFTYRYWNDPEAILELCRVINNATAEVVTNHPDRFLGLATVSRCWYQNRAIEPPTQALVPGQRFLTASLATRGSRANSHYWRVL